MYQHQQTIIAAVAALVISGCVTPNGKTYSSAASSLSAGQSEGSVVAVMGSPDRIEIGGNGLKLLKYCSTGFSADDMIYVLLVNGGVRQVITDTNTRGGACSSFFKSADWQSTTQSGYLTLNNLPAPTGPSLGQVMSESLQRSQQQNNQMYQSLIESMGNNRPRTTNCNMLGSSMNCTTW